MKTIKTPSGQSVDLKRALRIPFWVNDYFKAHPVIDEHLKTNITAGVAAIALVYKKDIFVPNHNSMDTTFTFYFNRFGQLNVDSAGEVDTKNPFVFFPAYINPGDFLFEKNTAEEMYRIVKDKYLNFIKPLKNAFTVKDNTLVKVNGKIINDINQRIADNNIVQANYLLKILNIENGKKIEINVDDPFVNNQAVLGNVEYDLTKLGSDKKC